jgi:hypothetical protein
VGKIALFGKALVLALGCGALQMFAMCIGYWLESVQISKQE